MERGIKMFSYTRVKMKPEQVAGSPSVEFWQAVDDLKKAEYNFQNATPEYFDIANAALTAARAKVNAFSAWVKE